MPESLVCQHPKGGPEGLNRTAGSSEESRLRGREATLKGAASGAQSDLAAAKASSD
jgi:hypothetical protein